MTRTQITLRKLELEAKVANINDRLSQKLRFQDARPLKHERYTTLQELRELEVRLQDFKSDKSPNADSTAWLLLVEWEGEQRYFATRENLGDLLVEGLVELGEDMPPIRAQTRLTEEQAQKLPAWVWDMPADRDPEGDDDA